MLDAFAVVGLQDEAGVVVFVDAIGDFGIAVRVRVGMLLAGEAQDHTGVIFPCRRESVRLLPCSDLEARPFAPQVDAARGFDDVGNVRAADASCALVPKSAVARSTRFQSAASPDASRSPVRSRASFASSSVNCSISGHVSRAAHNAVPGPEPRSSRLFGESSGASRFIS